MIKIKSRILRICMLMAAWAAPSLPAVADGLGDYELTVIADPAIGGTFNTSGATLAGGEQIQLQAYSGSNFSFDRWVDSEGHELSVNSTLTFTMPASDATVIAKFVYNPANPTNPAQNYWNPLTGDVIIDDFEPGRLSGAVSSVIGNSNSGDVLTITVAGNMNSNDYNIINYYSNCSVLDLSRVSGLTAVPSYAFDYTKLETVYLPATIEKLGQRSFYQCSRLGALTIYAMTPPTLEQNVFTGISDNFVVYVPAASIPLYQEAAGWSGFTILPIQDDIRSLTISLPADAVAEDYANMWLELTNNKSGQKMHYVMGNRAAYTFGNIIRNTSWRAAVRNERGDEFGSINNIEVKDEDVSVRFGSLSKPRTVSLSVSSPDGEDVTSQLQTTWTDSEGNYIASGRSISGLPEGCNVNYRVELPQSLAMQYQKPDAGKFSVNPEDNTIRLVLAEIGRNVLSGTVLDSSSKLPLRGVTVSASQTFGGKYSRTESVKTDNGGKFSMEVSDVATLLTISAEGYVNATADCDTLTRTEGGEILAGTISLNPISGAVLTLSLNYFSAGEEMATLYSDYNNIEYEIYNRTQRKPVKTFSVQYPQIVLMEDAAGGDELEITAASKNGMFNPVKSTVVLTAELRGNAVINIVEQGKIHASYNNSVADNVIGSLYDNNGRLIKTYDYSGRELTISNLQDGNYTLLTMGRSDLLNSISEISRLTQLGLTEKSDYILSDVRVESGKISDIEIVDVPVVDETKLYYTGTNTSFVGNKPSLVVGNYLTLSGRIDFKSAYVGNVSNVSMIVDLPEGSNFVENSVMVGNNIGNYTLNGNRLTIPMAKYTDRVRFCVIPTEGKDYVSTGFVEFDLNGRTILQPIGTAQFTAKNLSIMVPSVTADTKFPVSGTANGASEVEIYDGNTLIGKTKSLANGSWATTCQLVEPYNLSAHNIHAKAITKSGLELSSESVNLTYDRNAIKVSKVTMYHWNREINNWTGRMEISEFDFLNPSTTPTQWTVYYPDKKFTYTIEFTRNDPERISNVILYVHTADGRFVPVNASFDENKGMWYAEIDMGTSSNGYYPINCSVDFDYKPIYDKDVVLSQLEASQNEEPFPLNDFECLSNDNANFKISINSDDIDILLIASIKGLDIIPQEFSCDTIIDGLQIWHVENTDESKLVYLFNQEQLLHLASKDEVTSDAMQWIASIGKPYVEIEVSVKDKATYINGKRNNMFKAPSAGQIAGTSFYAVRTALRFYQFSRTAQDHFQQLVALDDRLNAMDCIDDGIKEEIRGLIDRLFHDYFNIKATSTFMQSGRFPMTSPLYAISYAGGWLNFAAETGFSIQRRKIANYIDGFGSACPPPPSNGGGAHQSGSTDDGVYIDPSGFVYEGVFSNRLEGVTATAYYKEYVEDMYGDLHENVVKWDAETYAQENPLFTDKDGYYRWDVPQGLWQVKFEKDGYETTQSEWLPVPPPQLEVNIGMTQNVQPVIKHARAYEDAVELEFDKYMEPSTLLTDNIMVSVNDVPVAGKIELLNEEVRIEGAAETFASRLRFNADSPFDGDEVTLTVSNRVKSYAGVRMQDDYSQTFSIEPEIRAIVCDSLVSVGYGRSKLMTVSVVPAVASAGKTLNVRSVSPIILTTDAESVVLDSDGKAEILLTGELPGSAGLRFEVEDHGVSAITMVNVVRMDVTANPVASIPSGSHVVVNTELTLSCDTEGALIYYTLDGSCPCDPATRILYDGNPIVLTRDVTIKAVAQSADLPESEIVEFVYHVGSEVSITELENETDLLIYPLPIRDNLNVSLGGEIMITDVTLTDMSGVVVRRVAVPGSTISVDVSELLPGIYILRITSEKEVYRRKIVIL